MAHLSDPELKEEINEILKNADLKTFSAKNVVQKLEDKFNCDLSDRKKVINILTMEIVNSMESSEEEFSDEDEDEESEEEKPKPKPKPKAAPKRKAESDAEEEEKENDSDDSSEGTRTKRKAAEKKKKPASKAKKGAAKKKGGGGKGSGYTRSLKLSPALAELMGAEELPRHEVVKRVWAIIKEKQLFDPNNRQFAICDKALYKVIGTQRFHTFGMMKYLKNHFID